jgi:hypothetical protein
MSTEPNDILSDAVLLDMLTAVGGRTITSARGSFVGVFGNEYAGIGDGLANVESSAPMIHCRTSDVARLMIDKEERLTIDGAGYYVVGHQPDGTGETVLMVREE